MKRLPVILLVLGTSASWAALPTDTRLEQVQSETQIGEINRLGSSRIAGLNGLYKFSGNTEVIPKAVIFKGEIEDNIGGVSLDVHKDETVAVEFLESGDVLMTLRLPDEEVGKIPEQLILSLAEFNELGLKMKSTGTAEDLKQKYTGYFDTTVAARRQGQVRPRRHTVRMQSSKRGNLRRDRNGRIAGGGGNCVAVVKALTGFVGTAGNGVGMASALMRRGWQSISFSSRRKGTVCSWSGGFHGKGHVGYFDGSCFVPTYGGNCGSPGKNYRLRNCVARG